MPVGGKAELSIILSPNALIKFDTRIQVAIRGWKTLELRVGGSVEPPCIDIDLVRSQSPSFNDRFQRSVFLHTFLVTQLSPPQVEVLLDQLCVVFYLYTNLIALH